MTRPIRNVAVLGAGAMGSGIAAHCANAGIPVLLLDIVPPNLSSAEKHSRAARNRFADAAVASFKKAKPAPLFHASNARLITTGNFDDDLERITGYDLIVEAVLERIDVKRALFDQVDRIVDGTDAIVASNTSGLRIAEMLEGRSKGFRQRFLVTHFFNPPRYMKLLELVAGPDTAPAVMARAKAFGENALGKGIVVAKDAPNFVANRIGTHSMLATVHQMLADGLAPEDIDNICGAPMGKPQSAVFRTADFVGIDVLAHVAHNCYESLTQDEDREVFKLPAFIATMVEAKRLGNKTKGGFYKKVKDGIETLDPATGAYRARGGSEPIKATCKALAKVDDVRERVRKLVATDGPVGEFAWKVIGRSLAYTARRVGEICDDIDAIDDGMKWGYNWDLGPFETWDALGFAATYDRLVKDGYALPASVKKMREAGVASFYRADGAVYDLAKATYVKRTPDPRTARLEVMRRGEAAVLKNPGAEAWDLGDGVLGVTFKTKANSLDNDVIAMLDQAVTKAEDEFRAMIIFNRGEHFCVGANLFAIVMAAGQKNWDGIRQVVTGLHKTVQKMKYAQVPVVAAPYGMTVGGGLEICLASSAVQAAAETYAGLVEPGVGLIPGGGGTVNMLWRALEGIPEGADVNTFDIVGQVFKNIAMVKVATSAVEAQRLGYFRTTDGVSFDKARLCYEAKAKAIGMAEAGYHPPIPRAYKLPGETGIATLQMLIDSLVNGGMATTHDGLIARKLAEVLCGGAGGAAREVTEAEMLELEREAFVSLCGEQKSQDRMQHMLMKNQPLRN
jgi:3-hydroxyacyl-CoA dehydrogenase